MHKFLVFGALRERIETLRQEARAQLRGVRVPSADPAYALFGATAEVLEESENVQHEDGQVDAYYLTQVVRNPAGEYFLLKTTDKQPYVKHLTQSRAKVVLKHKYLARDDSSPKGDA